MMFLKTFLIALVAFEHIYFMILEMFMWTKPQGIKTFGLKSKEFAEETKILAANQGLYNGFLAAGLIYSLAVKDNNTASFFLICVIVAGIYGAYSSKKVRLFYVQAIPASIALAVLILL